MLSFDNKKNWENCMVNEECAIPIEQITREDPLIPLNQAKVMCIKFHPELKNNRLTAGEK